MLAENIASHLPKELGCLGNHSYSPCLRFPTDSKQRRRKSYLREKEGKRRMCVLRSSERQGHDRIPVLAWLVDCRDGESRQSRNGQDKPTDYNASLARIGRGWGRERSDCSSILGKSQQGQGGSLSKGQAQGRSGPAPELLQCSPTTGSSPASTGPKVETLEAVSRLLSQQQALQREKNGQSHRHLPCLGDRKDFHVMGASPYTGLEGQEAKETVRPNQKMSCRSH